MSHGQNALASRQRQRGLSLLNLIMLGIVLSLGLLVVMPTFPALLEYRAIQAAVDKAATDPAGTPVGVRKSFDRSAAVEDISSIKGSDLSIERTGRGLVVSYSYQRRFPLFGPASLVFDFQGSSKPK